MYKDQAPLPFAVRAMRRPAALGAVCLSVLAANLPYASATTLVPDPNTHTPQNYIDGLQAIVDQSEVPVPRSPMTISREDCGSGEAGGRASCIKTTSDGRIVSILLRPNLKNWEKPIYLRHEMGHFTDFTIIQQEAAETGAKPDFTSAETNYRINLLLLGKKARTYAQAKFLIDEGPAFNADGSAVIGRKYWAQEYVAELNAHCQAESEVDPKLTKQVKLEFYGQGTSLRAKAYNHACGFIKRYLSADRQYFEWGPHH